MPIRLQRAVDQNRVILFFAPGNANPIAGVAHDIIGARCTTHISLLDLIDRRVEDPVDRRVGPLLKIRWIVALDRR
jgi:hypothetical protein